MRSMVLLLAFAPCAALAQSQTIRVAEPAWLELAAPEREILSARYLVNIFRADGVGVITDAQTINRSTPGTTAGSQIGSAYGSAAYVDHAFRGSRYNYSATNHVTATLAGALVGAMLDQPARANFHSRYAIKTLDGQIVYRDEVKGDAFRHPVGVCVALVDMQPVDQAVCTQTVAQLRSRYLTTAAAPPPPPAAAPEPPIAGVADAPSPEPAAAAASPDADVVKCKFGGSAPVMVPRNTCLIAQGEIR